MILIGTPSYDGKVSIHFLQSMLALRDLCRAAGVGAGFLPMAYDSLIPRARNAIASAFLRRKEYSHLLFIDADLGFPADAALRYLRADRDVVCGVYPVKRLDVEALRRMPEGLAPEAALAASLSYAVRLKESGVDEHGLVPVEYGPTGFMMIRRQVFERMAAAYPELRYRGDFAGGDPDPEDCWAFFDTLIDPESRDYLPEDYAFCKRWRDLGGTVHADVLSRFIHGGSCDFPGDFPLHLRHAGAAGRGA